MLSLILLFFLLQRPSFDVTPDAGVRIDGNGVTAASCTDEGNGLDPHGKPCTRNTFADEGSGLDPHG
ncbi:MAG TPA: hypothetical protein VHW00_02300 [Thermoanaerobaculia bacterium]|nr:hypothetical protein [Thermoanaerobaculia bacterium]